MYEDELTLEALDLAVGTSKRVTCPKCQAKDERSLKLTRTESGISYVCFRGKCGLRGYTGQAPSGASLKTPKYCTLRPFTRPTTSLTDRQIEKLTSKYGLQYQEIKANLFKSQTDEPRLVMPIFDAVGDTVGYVAKLMKKVPMRKSLTYWHKERPPMHYPRCAVSGGPVAILESTLDSVRVARYCRARAILGTYLSDLCVEQLRRETDHIILALDGDMIPRMVRMAQQLRGVFKVDIVNWGDTDPKDLPDNIVRATLEEFM